MDYLYHHIVGKRVVKSPGYRYIAVPKGKPGHGKGVNDLRLNYVIRVHSGVQSFSGNLWKASKTKFRRLDILVVKFCPLLLFSSRVLYSYYHFI